MSKSLNLEVYGEWKKTGELTMEMAEIIKDRFEDIIKYELSSINDLINKNKAHQAYSQMLHTIAFLNLAIKRLPSIEKDFNKWLYHIRTTVEDIAVKTGAKYFNISSSMSQGILINITYEVD